jgi:hypothetical protein
MQCLQSCRTCSPSNNASFQHKPRNYREDVANHRNPQLAICGRRQPTVLFASSKAFSATSIYRTVGLRQPPAERVTWRRRRLIRTITRSNHCPNTSRTAITKRLAHQNPRHRTPALPPKCASLLLHRRTRRAGPRSDQVAS